MEKGRNRPQPLVEYIDGDLDHDILGGIMANMEFIRQRNLELEETQDSSTLPHSGVIFEANSENHNA